MKLKETTIDGINYVCPTWDQMGIFTFQLARQIIESGRQVDKVVALAKGGWTWARTLVDHMGVDQLSSMRIKSYSGVNENTRPQIIQPLADAVNGMNVLAFDEVADTGESLEIATTYLRAMGVNSLAVAALCYKPQSKVVPDYFAFKTEAWVVFPHEIREFIDLSYKKWASDGLSHRQMIDRLLTIGLPEEQVNYFINLKH